MDISFRTDEGRFNYRICAVMIHENQLLAMYNADQPAYYYLPGGRVKLHEQAEEAVLRELREELGIEAKIDRALWLNQAFFTEGITQEKFHELCLYFLVDYTGTDLLDRGAKFSMADDEGKVHVFEWIPFHKLPEMKLYPLFIKEHINKLPDRLEMMKELK